MKKKNSFETEQETDGRWIAEIPEIPGLMAYGATKSEAITNARLLAQLVESEKLHQSSD